MNKELKNFIKEVKTDLGKNSPTAMGIINFHRRLKAARLIANEVFDKGTDSTIILALYEYLVKEEIASVWLAQMQAQRKGSKGKKNKKESVIAEAPEMLFSLHPEKMSN